MFLKRWIFSLKEILTYRTISTIGEGFYKEKGSKFLAFIHPISSELEVKEIIQNYRKNHHLAVHVCSAFRLGYDKKLFRSSDDGEPSNSAGPPILGQIQSFDLTNVLIAIVRYYGGTNLGVGGLITAYKTAAKEAIENTEIIEKNVELAFEIHFSYEEMPKVMACMKHPKIQIIQQNFALSCEINCKVPLAETAIIEQIKSLENIKLKEYGIV